jgi:PAS domain S-box-containing protein
MNTEAPLPRRASPAAPHLAPDALVDGVPGMVYVARPDLARTIEFASAGTQALLGFKPDGKPFPLATLIHPADHGHVLEAIKSALAVNEPFAIEYRVRHASGQFHTVWDQGRPIRHGGHPAVQGHLLDVTHRVNREQARVAGELQTLQLQKFQALNQLAGGVAHEFNNLIAGILGSAELLAMDLPEGHPAHDTLKQILEASNHARDFVHRLRLLGQRPAPELKPVRLQPVIEECLQILRNIIPAKVELHASIDPDCARVNADAAHIHQALLDLCIYAWQGLADRRGRITISLDQFPAVQPPPGTQCLLQPGPHLRLTVQDDSPGLDKHARDHIFHPFRIRRTGGKKVGLELFLVRETVQAHQGEIFLESEPGAGLTFRIYLPLVS